MGLGFGAPGGDLGRSRSRSRSRVQEPNRHGPVVPGLTCSGNGDASPRGAIPNLSTSRDGYDRRLLYPRYGYTPPITTAAGHHTTRRTPVPTLPDTISIVNICKVSTIDTPRSRVSKATAFCVGVTFRIFRTTIFYCAQFRILRKYIAYGIPQSGCAENYCF